MSKKLKTKPKAKTTEKLRAVGYCRTSSENQRDNTSIPVQKREIEHFIDCVLNDKEPLTPGEHGRYSLECAWAAIKSFQTNQPVALPLEKPYPSY